MMYINNLDEIPNDRLLTSRSNFIRSPGQCEKCNCFYIFEKSTIAKYLCCIKQGDEICNGEKDLMKKFEEIEKNN